MVSHHSPSEHNAYGDTNNGTTIVDDYTLIWRCWTVTKKTYPKHVRINRRGWQFDEATFEFLHDSIHSPAIPRICCASKKNKIKDGKSITPH